jgi:hypothetical protein
MRKTYPTDLSEAEWIRLRWCLLTPKAVGRPRIHSPRDVRRAIATVSRSPTLPLLGGEPALAVGALEAGSDTRDRDTLALGETLDGGA